MNTKEAMQNRKLNMGGFFSCLADPVQITKSFKDLSEVRILSRSFSEDSSPSRIRLESLQPCIALLGSWKKTVNKLSLLGGLNRQL